MKTSTTDKSRSNSAVSKRYIANFITAALFFSQPALADDPRAKTEGTFETCIDCVVSSASFGNSDLEKFREFNQDVTLISKDPTGKTFIDPREVIDRRANPQLNAIGMLVVKGKSKKPARSQQQNNQITSSKDGLIMGAGSGTLINECLVLTNHHVPFQDRAANDIEITDIEFFSGASSDKKSPFAFRSKGHVISKGNYTGENDDQNDWAIIKLDVPVADPKNPNHPRAKWQIPVGFIDFRNARGKSYSSASFYNDIASAKSGEQLWGQKECAILSKGQGKSTGSWTTNCASLPGVSGSSMLSESKRSDGSVSLQTIGILKGSESLNRTENSIIPGALNKLVPASDAFSKEDLQKIIDANPCTITTRA